MEIDSPENPKGIEDPLNLRSTSTKPGVQGDPPDPSTNSVWGKSPLNLGIKGSYASAASGGLSRLWEPPPLPEESENMMRMLFPDVVSFSNDELMTMRNPWEFSLVGTLLGPRRVSASYLATILESRWTVSPGMRVISLANGYFLFKFTSAKDKAYAISGGPWVVVGQLLALETWTPDFRPPMTPTGNATVWVRLPQLPPEYWGIDAIRKVVAKIGTFLKLDDTITEEQAKASFARVCVRIDGNKPLMTGTLIGSNGESFWQRFVYEGISSLCHNCGRITHIESMCKFQSPSVNGSMQQANVYGPWLMVNGGAQRTAFHVPAPRTIGETSGTGKINNTDQRRLQQSGSFRPMDNRSRHEEKWVQVDHHKGKGKVQGVKVNNGDNPMPSKSSSKSVFGTSSKFSVLETQDEHTEGIAEDACISVDKTIKNHIKPPIANSKDKGKRIIIKGPRILPFNVKNKFPDNDAPAVDLDDIQPVALFTSSGPPQGPSKNEIRAKGASTSYNSDVIHSSLVGTAKAVLCGSNSTTPAHGRPPDDHKRTVALLKSIATNLFPKTTETSSGEEENVSVVPPGNRRQRERSQKNPSKTKKPKEGSVSDVDTDISMIGDMSAIEMDDIVATTL